MPTAARTRRNRRKQYQRFRRADRACSTAFSVCPRLWLHLERTLAKGTCNIPGFCVFLNLSCGYLDGIDRVILLSDEDIHLRRHVNPRFGEGSRGTSAHIIEQLGQLGERAFNLSYVFMPFLNFAICRTGLSITCGGCKLQDSLSEQTARGDVGRTA